VRTYLGVDNVHDLFMPMVDGDMWTEARMLMESCRFYDIDAVAEWACQKPVPLKAGEGKTPAPGAPAAETPSAAEKEPVKKRAASGGRSR
jgi:cytosine deaminase